jgi:hypothetical protein
MYTAQAARTFVGILVLALAVVIVTPNFGHA